MSLWFYADYKQYEEALYQNLILSYAYFIYCNLFTVKTEIILRRKWIWAIFYELLSIIYTCVQSLEI
jgi:hypothetical protein